MDNNKENNLKISKSRWNKVIIIGKILRYIPYILFLTSIAVALYFNLFQIEQELQNKFIKYFQFYGRMLFFYLVLPIILIIAGYIFIVVRSKLVKKFWILKSGIKVSHKCRNCDLPYESCGLEHEIEIDKLSKNEINTGDLKKVKSSLINLRTKKYLKYRVKKTVITSGILLGLVAASALFLYVSRKMHWASYFLYFHFFIIIVFVFLLTKSENFFETKNKARVEFNKLFEKIGDWKEIRCTGKSLKSIKIVDWLNKYWFDEFLENGPYKGSGVSLSIGGYPALFYLDKTSQGISYHFLAATWISGYSYFYVGSKKNLEKVDVSDIVKNERLVFDGLSSFSKIEIGNPGISVVFNQREYNSKTAIKAFKKIAELANRYEGKPVPEVIE